MTSEQSSPPRQSTLLPPAPITIIRASSSRQRHHRGAFPPAVASVAALPSPIGFRVSWDRFAGQVYTVHRSGRHYGYVVIPLRRGPARENRVVSSVSECHNSSPMWEDTCFAGVIWTSFAGLNRINNAFKLLAYEPAYGQNTLFASGK